MCPMKQRTRTTSKEEVKSFSQIPGPRGLPLVGNALKYSKLGKKRERKNHSTPGFTPVSSFHMHESRFLNMVRYTKTDQEFMEGAGGGWWLLVCGWTSDSYCSIKTLMVGDGGSSAGSYLADPTPPPSPPTVL